jgi:hypothetical protein
VARRVMTAAVERTIGATVIIASFPIAAAEHP